MSIFEEIKGIDKPRTILLLEGKRNIPVNKAISFKNFSKSIAEMTSHIIFRSGNAVGSDYEFSSGVFEVCPQRLEIIKPYNTHRKGGFEGSVHYSLDDLSLEEKVFLCDIAKKYKKYSLLIELYIKNPDFSQSFKAKYILRDTLKVTEIPRKILPATAGVFYADPKDRYSGGTGYTIKLCEDRGITVYTQSEWMEGL